MAVATFPSIAVLHDQSLLAIYRAGPAKDSEGSTTMLRRSKDGGRTWSESWKPFADVVAGVRGSLQVVYVTPIKPEELMAVGCWVNRDAFPGAPLFNGDTEGCLPMDILVADSKDNGTTWTEWRKVAVPDDIGPASLTNPILRFPSGRLVISIESNKNYLDSSKWFQRVVHVSSYDGGVSWSEPHTVSQDPSGALFYWDQRAAVSHEGTLATFSWMYNKPENRYLNIRRRVSRDQGLHFTEPEEFGFADQPSHPAVLADGSAVLAWVDRYGSQSIRARWAPALDGAFAEQTEVVIYEASRPASSTANTGELLTDMSRWSFGLPYAEALPDGGAMVVYYAGTPEAMDIHWARLEV
jgi:hypothetical protein